MAKNFWLIIERGSYVATLFVGLISSRLPSVGLLAMVPSIAGGPTFILLSLYIRTFPAHMTVYLIM